MIYPVVKYGDDVLARKADTVTQFDKELQKLVEDMFESMRVEPDEVRRSHGLSSGGDRLAEPS